MGQLGCGKENDATLERRLEAYDQEALASSRQKRSAGKVDAVLACSMAVGAVLGLAQPSLAAIHYSGPRNLALNAANPTRQVDFGIAGQSAVFPFDVNHYSITYFNSCRASVAPGNGLIATTTSYSYARKFTANDAIDNAVVNWQAGPRVLNGHYLSSSFWGNFGNTSGYLGVRIPVSGSPGSYYYGWIQYQGTTTPTGDSGVIVDWAYEDTPDLAIAAGDQGSTSPTDATPVPALDEWGMLILFALLAGAGVAVTRRKRVRENA